MAKSARFAGFMWERNVVSFVGELFLPTKLEPVGIWCCHSERSEESLPCQGVPHCGGLKGMLLLWPEGAPLLFNRCPTTRGRFWFRARLERFQNRRRSCGYVEDFGRAKTQPWTKRCRLWTDTKWIPAYTPDSPGRFSRHIPAGRPSPHSHKSP